MDVWASGTSGVGRDTATKLSYYVKGPVVGFLLDARIRRATGGTKSLDDVMRLAYRRYSGERGFTPEQFRATAEEVAGTDLKEWFRKALASTEELDYREALDWFGLRFAPSDDPAKAWKLEVREDATAAQKAHFRALMAAPGAHDGPGEDHAGRNSRWRTTLPPGRSRPPMLSLQIATPAAFSPVQKAVPTGDDPPRSCSTLMVPATSRRSNAPMVGPALVKYPKIPFPD